MGLPNGILGLGLSPGRIPFFKRVTLKMEGRLHAGAFHGFRIGAQ